jgi:hypothetical protein
MDSEMDSPEARRLEPWARPQHYVSGKACGQGDAVYPLDGRGSATIVAETLRYTTPFFLSNTQRKKKTGKLSKNYF